MATDFQQTQTDVVNSATLLQALCSGNSNNTGGKWGNQADVGGSAGASEVTVTMDISAADLNAVWMELIDFDDGTTIHYGGESGSWFVQMFVQTGNHQIVLDEIHICRIDSGDVNQGTLASQTGVGFNMNVTGAQSFTLSQGTSADNFAEGDKVAVIFAFDNGSTMTQAIGYIPSVLITAPGSLHSLTVPSTTYEVIIQDALPLADSEQRGRETLVTDPLTMFDMLRKTQAHFFEADPLVLQDTLYGTTSVDYPRDAVLVDLIFTTVNITRSLPRDTVALSDRVQKDLTRFFLETLILSDTATATFVSGEPEAQVFERLVQDALTLFDARRSDRLHRQLDAILPTDVSRMDREKAIMDTITVIDQLKNFIGRELTGDAIALSDTRQSERESRFLESVLLIDFRRSERELFFTDFVVLSDLATTEILTAAVEVLIQDALVMTDEVRKTIEHHEADPLLLFDQLLRIAERQRSAADAIVLSDTSSLQAERQRTVQDAILIVDRAVRARELFFRDPIPLLDSVTATRIGEATELIIRDTILIADFVRKAHEKRFLINVNLSDVTRQQRDLFLADALDLFDVLRSHVERVFTQRDTILITEEVKKEIVLHVLSAVLITDAVTADKITAAEGQTISRLAQDSLVLFDAFQKDLELFKQEQLVLSDSVTTELVTAAIERIVQDVLLIADATRLEQEKVIRDDLVLSSEVRKELGKRFMENVQVVDQILTNVERLRLLTDALSLFDSVLTQAQREQLIRDTILLEDTIRKLHAMHFFDYFPLADTVTRSVFQAIIQFISGVKVAIIDYIGATGSMEDYMGASAGIEKI